MAINTETVFTDAVTVVTAAWLNLMQQHLAGLITLELTNPTSTQITVVAGSDDAVASVYIDGKQRFRDTSTSVTFDGADPSGTYNVYVVAGSGDSFNLDARIDGTGPPSGEYRKIGTAVWNGSQITSIRVERGRNMVHGHAPLDGSGEISHADVGGLTTGDPHTQYMDLAGSRDFTGVVSGVSPTTDAKLATKSYIDGITVPGLPIGTILPFAGSVVPAGWFLCDGSSKDTAEVAALFAVIGYTYGGSASNFNLPDLRESFPLGKAAAGTGSTLGSSGGAWLHTHTQPTHTHTGVSHTHATTAHTHSIPTTGNPSANHSHTQSAANSGGAHTHTGPSHTHSGTSFSVAATAKETVGAAHASQATAGLFAENAVDSVSDYTTHSHSAGTLTSANYGSVCGTSATATASHYHYPSGNSYEHTHASGSVYGSTGAAGTGTTSSSGAHTHTNPTTSTSSNHTHSGGTTGSATPSTNSSGSGASSADGNEATGSSAMRHIVMNYIIRAG